MRLSHFQNESYVPQLFTRKFSPKEPKCFNGLAVRIGMASVFEKTAWKLGLYYDNAKKLLKMNEPFPAFLLTMMFSCENLALNMTKSLSFLFFYSTFQHFLVKYIKRLLWKG